MIHVFNADTADVLWQNIAKEFKKGDITIKHQGSRGGFTEEILHAAISISDPRQKWIASRHPPLNPAFALAEVIWIMTGRNDSSFINYYNSKLQDYAGEGDIYPGAYGYRLRKHLGLDQLERAYQIFNNDKDTRQVVLQIWDKSIDLPHHTGEPTSKDIPCNVLSLLKVRDNKFEWMQVIRSNDVFLGLPHNLVQFTSIQEIMAGWLNIDVGSYNQISDSLHLYEKDYENVINYKPIQSMLNTDSLALGKEESEKTMQELAKRIEMFIKEDLTKTKHIQLASIPEAKKSYQNMLCVVAAEAARRRGWTDEGKAIMSSCDNPALSQVWERWLQRLNRNQN